MVEYASLIKSYQAYNVWKKFGLRSRIDFFVTVFNLISMLCWLDRLFISRLGWEGEQDGEVNRHWTRGQKSIGINSKNYLRFSGMRGSSSIFSTLNFGQCVLNMTNPIVGFKDFDYVSLCHPGSAYYIYLTFETEFLISCIFVLLWVIIFLSYIVTKYYDIRNIDDYYGVYNVFCFISTTLCMYLSVLDFHKPGIVGEIERGTFTVLLFTGFVMFDGKSISLTIAQSVIAFTMWRMNYLSAHTFYGAWAWNLPIIVALLFIICCQDYDMYRRYSRHRRSPTYDASTLIFLRRQKRQFYRVSENLEKIQKHELVDGQYDSTIAEKVLYKRKQISGLISKGENSSNTFLRTSNIGINNGIPREKIKHQWNQHWSYLQESIFICRLLFTGAFPSQNENFTVRKWDAIKEFNLESLCAKSFECVECIYGRGIPLYVCNDANNIMGVHLFDKNPQRFQTFIQSNEVLMSMVFFLFLSQDARASQKQCLLSISLEANVRKGGLTIHFTKTSKNLQKQNIFTRIKDNLDAKFKGGYNKYVESERTNAFNAKSMYTDSWIAGVIESNLLFDDSSVFHEFVPDLKEVDSSCSISRLMAYFVASSFQNSDLIEFDQHNYTLKDLLISKKSVHIPLNDLKIKKAHRTLSNSMSVHEDMGIYNAKMNHNPTNGDVDNNDDFDGDYDKDDNIDIELIIRHSLNALTGQKETTKEFTNRDTRYDGTNNDRFNTWILADTTQRLSTFGHKGPKYVSEDCDICSNFTITKENYILNYFRSVGIPIKVCQISELTSIFFMKRKVKEIDDTVTPSIVTFRTEYLRDDDGLSKVTLLIPDWTIYNKKISRSLNTEIKYVMNALNINESQIIALTESLSQTPEMIFKATDTVAHASITTPKPNPQQHYSEDVKGENMEDNNKHEDSILISQCLFRKAKSTAFFECILANSTNLQNNLFYNKESFPPQQI